MGIRPEVSSIVSQAVAALADAPCVVTPAGIDKQRWLLELTRHMQANEPHAHAEIVAATLEPWYRARVEDFIRGSKHVAIESLTEWTAIAKRLREERAIVQVQLESGKFLTKRLVDCTVEQLEQLARQYESGSAALSRRAQFYRRLAQQMRLEGLRETAPLSALAAA